MPRSYVNNASNRSLGRVGMPVGSMPVSRGSSGGGGGGISSGYGGDGGSFSNSQSSSSSRTYVDNASNRSIGRVGMPVGSMPVSRGSSGDGDGGISYSQSSSSSRTYVDNASNRSLGRVGMPVGSMVVSKGNSNSDSSAELDSSASVKTYVDNAYNRKHERVGLEHGSAVIHKSEKTNVSLDSGIEVSPKVYKDNTFNRKLGRVGKPLGTCVYSRADKSMKSKVYVDNAKNRSLERVGQPLESRPSSKVSKRTKDTEDIIDKFREYEDTDFDGLPDDPEVDPESWERAISYLNKKMEEIEWLKERKEMKQVKTSNNIFEEYTGTRINFDELEQVKTSNNIFEEYTGTRINFDELDLHRKIGHGGFGDVYFAIWKGSVVAVKKLRVQRVSKRRQEEFSKEVLAFCNLNHPNIVKFIGACITTPNLCIVMEYMSSSLFEALHMKEDIELTDEEKLEIIRQSCEGLLYLHKNNIAHCDFKSQNVLLDYVAGKTCVAKITDFGLSMIKSNTESSMSCSEQLVRNVGTPRYSAPEVLRGEVMSAGAMMAADLYSLGMVIFEIIYEEEPFYDFGYAKLQKQVGENGVTPEIPDDMKPKDAVMEVMKRCWCFETSQRAKMEEVLEVFSQQTSLYCL